MDLGLIGCGKMGGALLRGLFKSAVDVTQVHVYDAVAAACESLAEDDARITAVDSNRAVAEAAEVLLLCVKPNIMGTVAQEIAMASTPSLCISIAAGIPLSFLEAHLGAHQRVIRVMPNTPALVGEGASGYALGERATAEDGALTKQLLQAVGIAHEVPERLLDAVTGLSGSGPAYIYQVIEAMADAGVYQGLPRPVAIDLAAQTVLGAAKMVLETGEHPGVLKDQVTSPGGTTIRGVAALEAGGLRHALISAVTAATERSEALGKQGV